jgi:hypothetical protein
MSDTSELEPVTGQPVTDELVTGEPVTDLDLDDVVHHEMAHHPGEHSGSVFSVLDTGFGKAVATGYLGGMVVIFVFMFFVINNATDTLSLGVKALISAGVAFWIGVMGGTIAVGMWSMKHERELFH